MNLILTQYRNLFGVYLKPQRARVALLVVLLLACARVWPHDRWHGCDDAVDCAAGRGQDQLHRANFNNTLRQRLARLTHQTLAFSKKLANHIGAI